jgi:poly(3-hydroxybutyrate) depolymerase
VERLSPREASGVPHPEMHGLRLLGHSNRDIHAANEIWKFFQSASP